MTREQFVKHVNRKPQYRELAAFGAGFEQVDAARAEMNRHGIIGPSYARGEWVMCKVFDGGRCLTLRMGAVAFADALRDIPSLVQQFA